MGRFYLDKKDADKFRVADRVYFQIEKMLTYDAVGLSYRHGDDQNVLQIKFP